MDKKNNISFVELESYTRPIVQENQRYDYVEYGDDNNYFNYLIDLYNDSTTNNSVINGAVELIYGEGLWASNEENNPLQWELFQEILKPKELRKVVTDFKMLGQCSIQITYGPGRKKILKMEHFPVDTLRSEIANELGEIQGYYYSSDWVNVTKQSDLYRFPAFGYGSGKETEIMYIKPYKPGSFYYSQVDYHGCLPYCELEGEIANFHINNVKNGFMAAALINFNNGEPESEETKFEIERKIQQKFSGTSNAGKFVLSFNDNKESAAEVIPVTLAEAHNQYQQISDESQNKIIVGHRVTSPMLLGIKDANGFSSNADEIIVASLHYEKTVLEPFRRLLLDNIDLVLDYNKMELDLYFKSLYSDEEEIIEVKEDVEEDADVIVEDQIEEVKEEEKIDEQV